MELIEKYFPEISKEQHKKFQLLSENYAYWNEKINVISRKDMVNFYERHVLYSLAIHKLVSFKNGSRIIDIGTGGGFPGLPLAILCPESQFVLLDSIGKKLKVINEVSKELEINNITTVHSRAEQLNSQFDYIISRAVTSLPKFVKITKHLIKRNKQVSNNGIYYLKGGDISSEIKELNMTVHTYDLKDLFNEDFFSTKKIVHIPY